MPLVYVFATPKGGYALSVWQGKMSETALPELTEEAVRRELQGYFAAYSQQRDNRAAWLQAIEAIGQWLWRAVWEPLESSFRQAQGTDLLLIPVGALNLLPLHAARAVVRQAHQAENDYALDRFCIRYAPSAMSWHKARESAATPGKLLAIDEPKPVSSNPLPNSGYEVSAVAAHFSKPQVLRHEQASLQAVLEALQQGYDTLHFSCHGGANLQNPLDTGLLLANDEMLTVQHFLDAQLRARLVTLSACETGMIGGKQLEEVVGLPAALLQAGVAGVVSSLWSVSDLSTMLLMRRFYELWRGEYADNPAAALQWAQQWVRDSSNAQMAAHFEWQADSGDEIARELLHTFLLKAPQERPFAHPYYWAAFSYVGV
jgi:CHAT domain-containing protein